MNEHEQLASKVDSGAETVENVDSMNEERLADLFLEVVLAMQRGTLSRAYVKNIMMPLAMEVFAGHDLLTALAIAIRADVTAGRLSVEAVQEAMSPLRALLTGHASQSGTAAGKNRAALM